MSDYDIHLEELYKDVILDHYSNPRCAHPIKQPTAKAYGYNPICGDKIEVTLKMDEEEAIQQMGSCVSGCSICKASGSMMCEELEGKCLLDVEEAIERFRSMMSGGSTYESESGDLEALEGVKNFPVRIKCALLPWVTLKEAICQIHGKRESDVQTEESA